MTDEYVRRANLGCGGQLAMGWTNIDRVDPRTPQSRVEPYPLFLRRDMRTESLPFADDEVGYAVCHHVLDLFLADDAIEFLKECHRVIRPTGVLRISVADTLGAIDAAERIDDEWFAPIGDHWANVQNALDHYLDLGGARKMFLTTTLVAHLLQGAGFVPYVVAYKHTLCSDVGIVDLDTRPNESIWLEGVA